MVEVRVPRRTVMMGAAALAVSSAACTTGPAKGPDAGVQGDGVTLPTYQPVDAVEPDLPGDAAGVPQGFLKYPRPTQPTTDGPPGTGGTVTAMFNQEVKAPITMSRNKWWQGLNERLGVTFDAQIMPGADYSNKLSTALTSEDTLTDIIRFPPGFPRMPQALDARCEDLTSLVSGDAVLDFPNLANLSTTSWRSMVVNGKIMGLPAQNIVGSGTWIVRGEITDQLGVSIEPANADEAFEMATAVTDPSKHRYAFGTPLHVVRQFGCAMWDAPHNWANVDGKFVKEEETDEFRAALEWAIKVWDAGLVHPDAFAGVNAPAMYQSGNVVFFSWGGVGWGQMLNSQYPDLDMQFMEVPAASGGGMGTQRLGTGITGLVAIKKQDDPDRVRELVSIINYLAAPFGSTEELHTRWGEEGIHHTWDEEQSTPVLTDTGIAEVGREFTYVGCSPYVVFNPGYQEKTKAFHDLETRIIPNGRTDASIGLYSATNDEKGSVLKTQLEDAIGEIMRGQRTLSDLDAALDEYRSAGGDQIREEFERALG